jgi:hypothetical protein
MQSVDSFIRVLVLSTTILLIRFTSNNVKMKDYDWCMILFQKSNLNSNNHTISQIHEPVHFTKQRWKLK